jgi:hypothetical protein
MKLVSLLALGAAAALAATSASAASLILDGNFSEGASVGSLGYATYNTGQAVGTGSPWVVGVDANNSGTTSVDLIGTYWASPPGGGYSVDLDGTINDGALDNSIGSIYQTFTVPVAGEYELSYYLSGNTGGGPAPKLYSVTVGGTTVDGSTTNSAYSGQWTLVTEYVHLDAGSNILTFASLDSPQNGQNGPVIGDVRIRRPSLPRP